VRRTRDSSRRRKPETAVALRPDDLNRLLFLTEQARRAWLSQALAPFSLSFPQWTVVDALAREGVSNMTSLARMVGGDRTTLTRTIDGLVSAGLVDRQVRPDDRRIVLVNLTASGAGLAARIGEAIEPEQTAMFARLAAAETDALSSSLARIYAELQRLLAQPPAGAYRTRPAPRALRRVV